MASLRHADIDTIVNISPKIQRTRTLYRHFPLGTLVGAWGSTTFPIFLDFWASRRSSILGVWAARGRETLPKGGKSVSRPPGPPRPKHRRFPAGPQIQKIGKNVAEQRQVWGRWRAFGSRTLIQSCTAHPKPNARTGTFPQVHWWEHGAQRGMGWHTHAWCSPATL